jgi:cholesterol transport system auxiliary component
VITNRYRSSLLIAIALALFGCSIGPEKREQPATYDLGPLRTVPASNPGIRATLMVPVIATSPWLDSPNMYYRLNYRDSGRPEAYTQSRWTAPPAALLTERVRARLAAMSRGVISPQDSARADYVLRVELEDFTQTFDAQESSKVAVRLRATMVEPNTRALHAQRTINVERAANPNAQGAAKSLAEASDAAVDELVAWVEKNVKQ